MTKQFLFSVLFLFTMVKGFSQHLPLYNFRVENSAPNKVYFDSKHIITGSNTTGFVISNKTINAIFINSNSKNGHYFTVNTPFTFWDNNTIRYEGGSNIISNSNPLPKFTLEHIINTIPEPESTGNVYYVSVEGSGKKDGSSPTNEFEGLKAAFNTLPKGGGNTIYVRAGLYKKTFIDNFKHNDKENEPNKIIGYQKTIGDLDNTTLYTYTPNNGNTPPNLDSTKYPVFDGEDRNKNTFCHIKNSTNYVWKNIAITNYKTGYISGAKCYGHFFDNMIMKDFGKLTAKQSDGDNGNSFLFNPTGKVYSFKFNNITIVDVTGTGIFYRGDNALFNNVNVYSTIGKIDGIEQEVPVTDYYIAINGGNNNIIINSLAYKNTPNGWGHYGHGFALKASDMQTEYNLIKNNTSINIWGAYEVRHPEVQYNVIKNNISHADIPNRINGKNSYSSALVNLLQGAKNNIFENNKGYSLDAAIRYGDNTEEKVNTGAKNNIIRNNVFYDLKTVFYVGYADSLKGIKSNHIGNKFYNNTFYKADKLFFMNDNDKPHVNFENQEIKNCIFDNIKNLNETFEGWAYDYNNFSNGIEPLGNHATSYNPLFKNVTTTNVKQYDLQLKPESQLVDAGTNLPEVIYDFNNVLRKNPTDIGAFEIEETLSNDAVSTSLLGYKLYPNPTSGFLHISKNNTDTVNLSLLNVSGAVLYTLDNIVSKNASINLSQYAKGIYFLKVESKQGNMVKKVILN